MNLMGMRFRDFTWRNNPVSLKVGMSRNIRETPVPYGESRAEELGMDKRHITGEGYFVGEDAMEQWRSLQGVFSHGGAGMLQLPGLEPFLALMDSLSLIGTEGGDLIRYAFSFTEDRGSELWQGSGSYKARSGESLWDYAYRYGRDIEELVKANPHIRDIQILEEGEEVVVP